VLNPLITDAAGGDIDSPKSLAGQLGLERRREAARVRALDIERAGILLDFHIDAPPSAVRKSGLSRAGNNIQRVWQGGRQGLGEFLEGDLGPIDGRPGIQSDGILFSLLEGSVLDEFGVDAAIT
jgi:hypothetical protein